MSKIFELIEELCPEGVAYKPLGEIAELVRGNGMPKTDFVDSGVGAIHYGQIYTWYGVWADKVISFVPEEKAVKLAKVNAGDIIITNTSENLEDVCKAVAWLGEDEIVTGGHATVIKHTQNPKYLSYYFQSVEFQREKKKFAFGTKVIDVSSKNLAKIEIPVPPLEVQEEIVRILDRFTLLEAELEAELEARTKQYAFYRDSLLFNEGHEYNYYSLSDLGIISTGKTPPSKETSAWNGELKFVTPSDISNGQKFISESARSVNFDWVKNRRWKIYGNDSVFVTCIGADMGKSVLPNCKCVVNQQINAIQVSREFSREYIFYWLSSKRDYLLKLGQSNGSTMPILNKSNFSKIEIRLPALNRQIEIAEKISKFDALVNDISSGLPAEIAARRKQYEYYRDKLLTFKELPQPAPQEQP